ncbi:FAD-dependent oxidoreductase [Streptomyces xiaopingdaonensis]|uniref:FAD-dependent oxidoreductase n=1 Tax=Streptomyces xiaopingdaonensis TaxID=1565415 RepID=UPI0002D3EF4F|nr:FAD-dependent oxidoreductase [Streptomyces xiaopingdaonensis]
MGTTVEGGRQGLRECDVLVVGSGAGALTGAYTAASAGLDVLVVERTPLLGGTSAYSGAACWLPGSEVQRRSDAGDSTESARSYLDALLGDFEQERREAFLRHAPEVVATLEANEHVAFAWQAFPDYFEAPGSLSLGRSVMPADLPLAELGADAALVRPAVDRDRRERGHTEILDGGRALIGRLLLAMRSTGRAEVRTRTAMTELTADGGRVTGAVVTAEDGTRATVRARRGVLLAAGGFERNARRRTAEGVPGGPATSMAPAGSNDGGPMDAATALGAATGLLDEAWWCPVSPQPDGAPSFVLGLRGGFLVDAEGRRFANESLPYDRMGRELAADAARRDPAHLVFDSREGGRMPLIAVPDVDPEASLAAGTWHRADTLEELARAIGVPEARLRETAEEFNASAAAGDDASFGRGTSAYDRFFADPAAAEEHPNPCLVPLTEPPYYAAPVRLGDLGTKGGLRTDAAGRVLRTDGTVLPGLYAAGNTAASLSGRCYPGPGIPLGTAMTFGYLAARGMASGA